MKIGLFSDTYFPQVSGVSTSIETLRDELTRRGHEVYIFTTTDPNAPRIQDGIIRMPSIPFISFKDRRVVVSGMRYAYLVAKEIQLDIVHTHTEFGTGWLGKFVAKHLGIPIVHTYHTMYEDYLHYVAKGYIIRPGHVERYSRLFCQGLNGVVCPSQRVVDTLEKYEIKVPKEVIPTGINLARFKKPAAEQPEVLRQRLGISADEYMLLSLSRLSYEKNIQGIVKEMVKIKRVLPNARLVIVGDGPYRDDLEKLCLELELTETVVFAGEVASHEVGEYYRAADFFLSCSSSESQGLTYTEAMAAGTPCIVKGNAYLEQLFNHPSLGITFSQDDQLTASLMTYITEKRTIDQCILAQKLYQISAECFGERICQLYQKAGEDYLDHQIQAKYEEPRTKVKVFRRSVKKSSER